MPRRPICDFDLNAFSSKFRDESDRACVVLGAALLDSQLERLYRRRLRAAQDDLLSGNGPIGAFSGRIKLAHALAWISDDVRYDLDLIRSIRNEFAHSFDHDLSFADKRIADQCRTLRVAKVLLDAHEDAASRPHPQVSSELIRAMGAVFEPPRQRFEITVEMLAQHLDELPAHSLAYQGPNLQDELWILGSTFDVKVRMTGTIEPAVVRGSEENNLDLSKSAVYALSIQGYGQ